MWFRAQPENQSVEKTLAASHSDGRFMTTSMSEHAYLVVRVHFGHHPFLQEVKGQHLQHVQLMRHLCFDGSIPSDDVLEKRDQKYAESVQSHSGASCRLTKKQRYLALR